MTDKNLEQLIDRLATFAIKYGQAKEHNDGIAMSLCKADAREARAKLRDYYKKLEEQNEALRLTIQNVY